MLLIEKQCLSRGNALQQQQTANKLQETPDLTDCLPDYNNLLDGHSGHR